MVLLQYCWVIIRNGRNIFHCVVSSMQLRWIISCVCPAYHLAQNQGLHVGLAGVRQPLLEGSSIII